MAWVKQCFNGLLRSGPIPQHLAFIMDGNRRFAKKNTAGDLQQGHSKGFDKLLEALEWCLELGVKCVTVYAFSIDNFNRSSHEVDTLMHLAQNKLSRLLEEEEIIRKHDLKVCILGDLSLLPADVQQAAERVHQATSSNEGPVLNICLAYLSSQEMAQALVSSGGEDQSLAGFQSKLYTKDCAPVDLLIRTSGETRLSDFLLWQSQHALLHFSDVLWPDFTFWHLLKAIVCYQNAYQTQKNLLEGGKASEAASDRRQKDIESIAKRLQEEVQAMESKQGQESGIQSDEATMVNQEGARLGFPDSASDTADSVTEVHSNQRALKDLARCLLDSPSDMERVTNARSSDARRDDSALGSPTCKSMQSQQSLSPEPPGNELKVQLGRAVQAPGRRKARLAGADRIDRSKKTQLLDDASLEAGLFQKPPEEPVSREEQLKKYGMRGGYDSLEDSDEERAHVNGCPCCIVKFLPMHRICTDPTAAIKAIRES